MIFKTLERYLVMAFQLVVQIIIARILSPHDYGIVAMMSVFIAIAHVFIQNGFNMAVVQKKNASEVDFGTALLINFLIGVVLYLLLVLFSSQIAHFYSQPLIRTCMPVMALLLVIGSINSIQIAIANRSMQFKKLFKANIVASIISGTIGILSAFAGLGVWALIIQQLGFSVVLGIVLLLQQHWVPKFYFCKKSALEMFSFGWNLLAAGLINQIYNELNSLVIGKKYTSSDLAFYTKGSQFPKLITMGIDHSISSVMFSAFSRKQEDQKQLHILIKKTNRVNSFFVLPLLMILAMIAKPLVTVLLTEKWLPIVPYMQICCFTFAFHPLGATQGQVIAAVGRSDIRLKAEFLKKGLGLFFLFLSLPYGPFYIALSAAATSLFGVMLGTVFCKVFVSYKIRDSIMDILPIIMISIVVGFTLFPLMQLSINPILSVILGIVVGFLVYLSLASIFKLYAFLYFRDFIIDKCRKTFFWRKA